MRLPHLCVTTRRRALLGVIAAAWIAAPLLPATAAERTTTALVGPESWYQPTPPCPTLLGCSTVVPPPTSPYPAGTLHVALTGAKETARSYLGLTVSVPPEARVTGGRLVVPVDTTPGSGTMNPETSMVLACPVVGAVPEGEGRFDAPPATDCTTSAKATYTAAPSPQLVIDLTPLAAQLSPPGRSLALVPDASAPGSWHIAYSSQRRAAPATPAATVVLTLSGGGDSIVAPPPAPEALAPSAPPTPVERAPGPASRPAGAATVVPSVPPTAPLPAAPPAVAAALPQPVTGIPAAPAPAAAGDPPPGLPVLATAPPASDPVTEPLPEVPAAPFAAEPVSVTAGYAYPQVWLLPLVAIAALAALGRALTADLTPKAE